MLQSGAQIFVFEVVRRNAVIKCDGADVRKSFPGVSLSFSYTSPEKKTAIGFLSPPFKTLNPFSLSVQ